MRWSAVKYLFSPHSPQSLQFFQNFTAFTAFLTKIYPKTSTREGNLNNKVSVLLFSSLQVPGWGAIRKWPLIRPSPTHTVCSQTKITGSGICFQCTIVWSEVTSVWGWYDQRSLRSGDGMIRGHFGLGMVWSEVTSVWGWFDQRSLRSGDGMIRGHFGLGMVWSEVTLVWGWYDQRSLRSGDGMIRGHFGLGMVWSEVTLVWGCYDKKSLQDGNVLIRGGFKRTLVWSETISGGFFFLIFCFFLQRDVGSVKRQQNAAFWSQTELESDVFDQNQRIPTDWTCQSPYNETLFNCRIRCFIWKTV